MRTNTKICNRNLHVWKADHTNYIWADNCFMILDSYVTFKIRESKVPLLPVLHSQSVEDVASQRSFWFLHGRMLQQTGYHLVIPWLTHSSFQGTYLFFWVRPCTRFSKNEPWVVFNKITSPSRWVFRKEIFVSFSLCFIACLFSFIENQASFLSFFPCLNWLSFVVSWGVHNGSYFAHTTNMSRLGLWLVQVKLRLVPFRKLKFIGLNVRRRLPNTCSEKSRCTFASQYLASQHLYRLEVTDM